MLHRTRRRVALWILLVGLPVYIVAAVSFVNWLDRTWGRLPLWAEVPLYAFLAIAWALPLKPVFRGVGQSDTDEK
jgi:hypothetical protein